VPSLTWCLQLGGDCQPDNIKSLGNVQSAEISRKRFTDMNYWSPRHKESDDDFAIHKMQTIFGHLPPKESGRHMEVPNKHFVSNVPAVGF
jgi:hypothetical protein